MNVSRRRFLWGIRCLLLIALVAVFSPLYMAQELPPSTIAIGDHGDDPSSFRYTSSQFKPPKASDTTFVTNSGRWLDTSCLYRSGGPLLIDVKVTRYIGNKRERQALIANKLLDPKVTLTLPAYDVDYATPSSSQPERDRVTINGHVVPGEFLNGANNIWKLNTFQIPVEWIKWPEARKKNGAPEPAINRIRIDIDEHNSHEAWCTAVDWVALKTSVVRPVLLVHGIKPLPGDEPTDSWYKVWVPELLRRGVQVNVINLSVGEVALESIQSNANRIGAVIKKMTNEYGVQQINIVSHSKGGLDSKHYARNHNTIETLVQIGTPNAGSPWADVGQVGLIALGVKFPKLIGPAVGLSLGLNLNYPALYQLTVAHMAGYNLFDRENPNVEYVSIAGDYEFGNIILDSLLDVFMLGDSDIIVPEWSVYWLDYAKHEASVTEKPDASHISQIQSDAIFARVKKYILRPSSSDPTTSPVESISAGLANANAVTYAMPPMTQAIADRVKPGETKTHTIALPNDNLVAVMLSYFEPEKLTFTLVSPSGKRIDKKTAKQSTDASYRIDRNALAGYTLTYFLQSPEAGNWSVEVKAVAATKENQVYVIQGILPNSPISLTGKTDKAAYRNGEAPLITARPLSGATTIKGASVQAHVLLPDNTTATVTLMDNGTGGDSTANDGVYNVRMSNLTKVGFYRGTVAATGNSPAVFSREALFSFTVSNSTTTMTTFTDAGKDTDNDGRFNQLIVTVGLNVSKKARYALVAELSDLAGNPIATTSFSKKLSAGAQTVNLSFSGLQIFNSRKNGPYRLSIIRLAEEDELGYLPLEERLNAYTTKTYQYTQFQRPADIFLINVFNDLGVDKNGNGLYDTLRLNVGINAPLAGNYEWSARLVDGRGQEVAFATGRANMVAGDNVFPFEFAGRELFNERINGKLTLRDVLVFNTNASSVMFKIFTTQNKYHFTQFEMDELLGNGGFEGDSTRDGQPDRWQVQNRKNDQMRCNQRVGKPNAVIYAATGRCAYQFKGTTGSLTQVVAKKGLTFIAGDKLELAMSVRLARRAKMRGSVIVTYNDGTQKSRLNLNTSQSSTYYREVYKSLTLASGDVKNIKVTLQGVQGGALVDDVSLRYLSALGLNTLPQSSDLRRAQ